MVTGLPCAAGLTSPITSSRPFREISFVDSMERCCKSQRAHVLDMSLCSICDGHRLMIWPLSARVSCCCRVVDISGNALTHIDGGFCFVFSSSFFTLIILDNNQLAASDVMALISSSSRLGALTVRAAWNNVREIPAYFLGSFQGILTVSLQHNPVTRVDQMMVSTVSIPRVQPCYQPWDVFWVSFVFHCTDS